ncbi:hypothetical protein BGZ74_005231 [Mortierella antarctica]|nr:hypothetical protein BGZ74_005231 [Mortierella antarctica]
MAPPPWRRKLRILSALFSLSATLVAAQSPPAHVQQSTDLCTAQVCISATVFSKDPTTIEFGIYSKISIGWLGLGMGGDPSSMAHNDLAVCWPSSSASVAVISQRSAAMNGRPSAVAEAVVPFKVQPLKSGFPASTGAKVFTCTYSRPLNLKSSPIAATAASIPVIFAIGLDTVSGPENPQTASFEMHAFTGMGTLPIVKKEGSSLDGVNTTPGGRSPNGGTDTGREELLARQKRISDMTKAHGVMMALVFLLILPVGASIPRFFGDKEHIFRWHRPLQVTGFCTALIAFILIIVATAQSPMHKDHFTTSNHALLGLVIVIAMVLQVAVGIYIFHTFDPTTHDPNHPTIPTWVHRGWGYIVLAAGFAQVHLGMKLYGAWPTGKEAIWYIYGVWVGLICCVFVFGSVFKRWRAKRARRRGNTRGYVESNKRREDEMELQRNQRSMGQNQSQQTSNGSDTVGDLHQYQL